MKVVVFSSSPRRHGNSEVLADQFIAGAKKAGHEVEKVVLRDYRINPCLACGYCRNHENQCCQNDDGDKLIKKIVAADVFVFATPVYFYSLSAQLKILIDRMFSREYEIRESDQRKKAYLIVTSGATDIASLSPAVESFRGFIKVLRKVDEGGIIYGNGAIMMGDANHHQAYQEAYEAGKNI